jgi:ElaB/YqjD/DUF883 family membrane-anchored ribosome-binding protein
MSERIQAAGAPHAESGMKDRALEAAATARESLGFGLKAVRTYIVKEPARALGLALGVGVLLGWLIKRR